LNFNLKNCRYAGYGLCAVLLSGLIHHACAQTKTITLIAEDEWYPYSAQRDGKSVGFVVEVVRAAYAAEGVDVKFKVASFKSCLTQVEEGTEVGCFDINQDDDTKTRFLFPGESLFTDTGGIYDMENSGLPDKVTPQSLVGYRVGYTNGAIYGEFLDKAKGIRREFAMSDLSNLRKLVAGRQDYSLISTISADYIFKSHPEYFPLLPRLVGVVSNQKMYVGFSLKRPDAKEAAALLDAGLIKIRANGTYKKIEMEWLGSYLPPEKNGSTKSKK
jgi:polar amino acid transport system substrate-binding protein